MSILKPAIEQICINISQMYDGDPALGEAEFKLYVNGHRNLKRYEVVAMQSRIRELIK